jgi:hypothetical protein
MVSGRIASAVGIGPDLHLLSRVRPTGRCLPKQLVFHGDEKGGAAARPLASFSWVAHHRLPYFLSRRETALDEVRPDAEFSFQPQTVPRQGNAFIKRHEHYDVEGRQLESYRTRVRGRIAGWGLVRTHAADAARVLPRPAPPRPLGATLLAPGAPPDASLLGAFASRVPATEVVRAIP